MKHFYLLLSVCLVCSIDSFSQTPEIKSSKHLSFGIGASFIFDAKPTRDKGFILGGSDSIAVNQSYSPLEKTSLGWPVIVKTDSAGNIDWKQDFHVLRGAITSVLQTKDGGYIAAGYQQDRAPYDSAIFTIVRLTAAGNVAWTKQLGGSMADLANDIIETNDGFLAVGNTMSNDGDVSGNNGYADVWVVKLDATGNVNWKKCFGGSGRDEANAVVQVNDNQFVIAGFSQSTNGNVAGNKGQDDGWILAIDASGNLLWQNNIGGSGDDFFTGITSVSGGGFLLTGYTTSNNGDVAGNHGNYDMWVVKTDDRGNVAWSRCLGGSSGDFGMNIQRTYNDNVLVAGYTSSTNGDVTSNNGRNDFWLLMVSSGGNIIWQKTAGTANSEYGMAAIFLSDYSFVMAGMEVSDPLGVNPVNDAVLVSLGNSNIIKGNAFVDVNLNGIRDNGEIGFDQLTINTEKAGVNHSTQPSQGQFSITADVGTFTSSFVVNSSSYTAVPASHVSTFTSFFNKDSFDIAVQPHPNQQDLTVSLLPVTAARPGFAVTYKLVCSNAGTIPVTNSTVQLIKDLHTTFTSASIAPASIAGNQLQWNVANLNPQEAVTIYIVLNAAAPPQLSNGDTLLLIATVDPVSGDITPADDTVRLKQIVTGSYDPNDLSEANAGSISRQQLTNGEYLTYLIRFQNTGTDTAFSVTIKDTLDDKLDWTTLQMVQSSNPYQLAVSNGNQLSWLFNDIKLVDSNRNEPASHGYLAYRIKPKSSLTDGDIIKSIASIYFDFNLPIQTNTQSTILAVQTALPVSLLKWNATMNNGKVVLSWQTSYEQNVAWYQVQYSADGIKFVDVGKVSANNRSASSYSFTHVNFVKGNNFYRLVTRDNDGHLQYSNILVIYVGAGKDIASTVYPNPVNGAVTVNLHGELKGNALIKVFDLAGKNLLSLASGNLITNSYSTVVNLGALSKGVYVIKITLGDYSYRQEIVVQ